MQIEINSKAFEAANRAFNRIYLTSDSPLRAAVKAYLEELLCGKDTLPLVPQGMPSPSIGCICPGDATLYCKNPVCPRRDPTAALTK